MLLGMRRMRPFLRVLWHVSGMMKCPILINILSPFKNYYKIQYFNNANGLAIVIEKLTYVELCRYERFFLLFSYHHFDSELYIAIICMFVGCRSNVVIFIVLSYLYLN